MLSQIYFFLSAIHPQDHDVIPLRIEHRGKLTPSSPTRCIRKKRGEALHESTWWSTAFRCEKGLVKRRRIWKCSLRMRPVRPGAPWLVQEHAWACVQQACLSPILLRSTPQIKSRKRLEICIAAVCMRGIRKRLCPSWSFQAKLYSEKVARKILQRTFYAVFYYSPINSGDRRPGADLDYACTRIPKGEVNSDAAFAYDTAHSAAVPGEICTV